MDKPEYEELYKIVKNAYDNVKHVNSSIVDFLANATEYVEEYTNVLYTYLISTNLPIVSEYLKVVSAKRTEPPDLEGGGLIS